MTQNPPIQPIKSVFSLEVLNPAQLAKIKTSTLHILENVGVRFPSKRALTIFAEYDASVDMETQIVKLSPDLVTQAMSKAPRTYTLSGRAEGTDMILDGTASYFSTDGCGTLTLDLDSGEQRASTKEDVGTMARVADHLSSIGFYWPMVSAQDYGVTAPLHEIDASFNNTVKHIQSETVMGAEPAKHAIRMAEVIAGNPDRMKNHPPLSLMVCTIAPLGQDQEGIEGAMAFAKAGLPVGFMGMPNMGSTAPVAVGGALAMATAEVVSAMTLMQLVAPGAPTFYSIVASVMNPRTSNYINAIGEKYLCHAAGVQIAHDWGVPILGGAFGVHGANGDSWQYGRDSVFNALMVPQAGADMVVGMGMARASTFLDPAQIILDDEIYHTCRRVVEGIDLGPDDLALDVIADVGPGGHFLSQKHTRDKMHELWIPELTHPAPSMTGKELPDMHARARAEVQRILLEHQPEPLEKRQQTELQAILASAKKELE